MAELTVKGVKVKVEMSSLLVKDLREKLGKTDEEIYHAFLGISKKSWFVNGDQKVR